MYNMINRFAEDVYLSRRKEWKVISKNTITMLVKCKHVYEMQIFLLKSTSLTLKYLWE